MSKRSKYVFNQRTLSYEVKKRSALSRALKYASMVVVSLGMAAIYFWMYTSVLGWELPKTVLL